ncbi:MAG: endonuclease III [Chloroflexi bacterium]|nr:endonuclease III [Chloroflexota bacterium]
MMRGLANEGYTTVFEQLVACIISVRTLEETSIVITRRLFERARTPVALAELELSEIDRIIHGSGFHNEKSRLIQLVAQRTVAEFGDDLPCDFDVLTSFPGVGPKCANLVLGIACGIPAIGVDIHVHRITNRWGYVHTRTPEQTLAALTTELPTSYWIDINALLVPFGKHVCTPTRPWCSTCPIFDQCQRIGVTARR